MLAALKNKISDEILKHNHNVISVLDFKTEFSPTLLCDFLEKPESGYSPVVLKSGKNKLFWTNTHNEEIKKMFQEKFDFMKLSVLLATRSINYPFTTWKALEEISKIDSNIDFFSTDILIKSLAQDKILLPSGESWRIPLKNRIISLLSENPEYVYSIDEIISLLSIPLMSKEETMVTLNSLQSEGVISSIDPKGWSWKGNETEKAEKRLQKILVKKHLHC